ncbi:MAG: hypothetical protein ABIS86_15590 [Streptosporangiaceae bacterium]
MELRYLPGLLIRQAGLDDPSSEAGHRRFGPTKIIWLVTVAAARFEAPTTVREELHAS